VLEAASPVSISTEASGRIGSLNVVPGQNIKKGDLIALTGKVG
jgi:multidrug resistance efflux pump